MISEQAILDAQKAWGDGIVKIGQAFLDQGDYRAVAEEHKKELYNYSER